MITCVLIPDGQKSKCSAKKKIQKQDGCVGRDGRAQPQGQRGGHGVLRGGAEGRFVPSMGGGSFVQCERRA